MIPKYNEMTGNLWTKYRTARLGFLGSLCFFLLCFFLFLIDKGEFIFPLLYMPGAIFGLTMTMALSHYSDKSILLFVLGTTEYLIVIFFCSKDFEYLVLRRILMGGLGAILFLISVSYVTNLKFHLSEYVTGFVFGLLTTIFLWIDNFESFNPWMTLLSIILWQTSIAAIINRKQLTSAIKEGMKSNMPLT